MVLHEDTIYKNPENGFVIKPNMVYFSINGIKMKPFFGVVFHFGLCYTKKSITEHKNPLFFTTIHTRRKHVRYS